MALPPVLPADAQSAAARADRAEDRIDRREDRRDRTVDLGPRDRLEDRVDRRENRIDRRTGPYRSAVNWSYRGSGRVVVTPPPALRGPVVVAPRIRYVRSVRVVRPFGPTIIGNGFRYVDDDAYPRIAFTAITLRLLDYLSEEQVRHHEEAQIIAADAPIGDAITWSSGGAEGAVVAILEGVDASGHVCREFLHSLIIDGQAEDAWGTACKQADGSWTVINP